MNETYKAEIKRLLNAIHDEDSLCKIYTLALVRANHEASQKQEGVSGHERKGNAGSNREDAGRSRQRYTG